MNSESAPKSHRMNIIYQFDIIIKFVIHLYSERGKLVHHGIGVLVYGGLVHSIILSFHHSKMNGPIYAVLSIVTNTSDDSHLAYYFEKKNIRSRLNSYTILIPVNRE